MTLLKSKDKRNREYKGYLNEETILCLLDEMSDKGHGIVKLMANGDSPSTMVKRLSCRFRGIA